jgi:hypothetical protein
MRKRVGRVNRQKKSRTYSRVDYRQVLSHYSIFAREHLCPGEFAHRHQLASSSTAPLLRRRSCRSATCRTWRRGSRRSSLASTAIGTVVMRAGPDASEVRMRKTVRRTIEGRRRYSFSTSAPRRCANGFHGFIQLLKVVADHAPSLRSGTAPRRRRATRAQRCW